MSLNLQQLRCKTCGEPLDLSKAQGGVIKCAVCDSCFTLPKSDASQKVLDFLSQGEHELDIGKFEDAYSAFNKAAELDKTEPEAYWGMALAEFKIQYLKDEVNNRLQPICHEVTDKDFADNVNFLKAIGYATEAQNAEYRRKADEINYIKNEFYKIAKTGVKYDCFICVKVSAEDGGRTQDYKTADDIYFELKGKGYKPFFSERELVGVTGADYEARILYALKSSECMLVVCFDEAYLRTKWVKNEYSRFLKLVNDEEKESDSIALVFGDRPVEKLPGKKGKIQGIALNSLTAMERIVSFVDAHTPEARKRREEQAKQKDKESDALKQRLAELENRLKNQQQTTLSEEELFEKFEKTRAERERREREERERREAEERARQQAEWDRQERERQQRERIARMFRIENGVLVNYYSNNSDSTDIVIPHGVTSIGKGSFYHCTDVTSVVIPHGVTTINADAFRGCTNLKSIVIPDGLTEIGSNAFDGCTALLAVDIPDSVTSLGGYAFVNCHSLINIKLSNSLTEIQMGTFAYCRALTNITIPNSVVTIDGRAFESCVGLYNVTISDGVTFIGSNAFQGCGKLKSITIPESITSIGAHAFMYCNSLASIIIPANVTFIGDDVFLRGFIKNKSFIKSRDKEYVDLKIYCRAKKQPKSWSKNWDNKWKLSNEAITCKIVAKYKTVWGYKGD